jgi:hypothetical protein
MWIATKNVTILLPDIIIDEWKRNRDKESSALIEDWKKFYKRVKMYVGKEAKKDISRLLTHESIEKRVEARLEKVEKIFSERLQDNPSLS